MPDLCNNQHPYGIANTQEESEAEEKDEQEKEEKVEYTADGVRRKTRAARNAKLRRLCQRRKNGTLAVPPWLHELWKTGNHSALSLQYEDAGYDKDRLIVARSRWL